MVVIDDPLSILRCTNKVFLHELLGRNGIPVPRTRAVNRDDRTVAADGIGFPCIVKQPDSSSSLGVFKADDAEALLIHLDRLFEISDLVLVQEFLPTDFDWRIGMLDRRPLYASRYFMAPRHWQIIKHDPSSGRVRYGRSETVPVEDVPPECLDVAMRAANLIGDSLYGVDLKPARGGWVVIEVNDNPSIDHGIEDTVLRDRLYQTVMESFLHRLEKVTGARSPGS
jgi:glutathione synthase/RimK-type ligase-like ATP-grasp enzyme